MSLCRPVTLTLSTPTGLDIRQEHPADPFGLIHGVLREVTYMLTMRSVSDQVRRMTAGRWGTSVNLDMMQQRAAPGQQGGGGFVRGPGPPLPTPRLPSHARHPPPHAPGIRALPAPLLRPPAQAHL